MPVSLCIRAMRHGTELSCVLNIPEGTLWYIRRRQSTITLNLICKPFIVRSIRNPIKQASFRITRVMGPSNPIRR